MEDIIKFRKYKRSDRTACAELSLEAWPVIEKIAEPEDFFRVMGARMEMVELATTFSEVVFNDSGVIGFLFGFLEKDFHLFKILKAIISLLIIIFKMISGRYGKIKRLFKIIPMLFHTDKKINRFRNMADGELVYFVISKNYRGKGLGRELISHFHKHVLSRGCKKIMLTTDELSNWKFYEIIGYKRVYTYNEKLSSYVTNRNINGFIYTIKL